MSNKLVPVPDPIDQIRAKQAELDELVHLRSRAFYDIGVLS
jgi:hypothetical protein